MSSQHISAKLCFYFACITTILTQTTACSLFRRHDSKMTHEQATSPDEQLDQLQLPPLSEASLDRGRQAYKHARYDEAIETLTGFIADYPSATGTEEAHELLGASFFKSAQYAKAVPHLKRVIENNALGPHGAEALLMLGEAYYKDHRNDEALATTFQIAPDAEQQKHLALPPEQTNRHLPKLSAPLSFQVRAYMLRAKIYSEQGQNDDATNALRKGKRLLRDATGNGIKKDDAAPLQTEITLGEMELLKIRCSHLPLPTTTTEESVLAFIDSHFTCIEPAKVLICDIAHQKGETKPNNNALQQAKTLLQQMTESPLALKEILPPPGRSFKEPAMQMQFEIEIKELIDKKSAARATEFRSIEECGLVGIF